MKHRKKSSGFSRRLKFSDLLNVKDLLASLNPLSSQEENIDNRRKVIKSFKAKANSKRTPTEKFADWLTSKFGSITFLMLNMALFIGWIVVNQGFVQSIDPFDPFPYGLLTTVVSLEAIALAIIVLISQNREARIGELREEIDLQINTITETEVTQLIRMMVILLEKQGVKIDEDPELRKMLRTTNNDSLQKELEKELES